MKLIPWSHYDAGGNDDDDGVLYYYMFNAFINELYLTITSKSFLESL